MLRAARLRLTVLTVVGFLIVISFTAVAVALEAARSARSCENRLTNRGLVHPQNICTPFSYGQGPLPADFLDYLRTNDLLKLPIYPNASITNITTEHWSEDESAKSSGARYLLVLGLSSKVRLPDIQSWYSERLGNDYIVSKGVPPEDLTQTWLRRIRIPSATSTVIFHQLNENIDRGVVLSSNSDSLPVQIEMFEFLNTRKGSGRQ